MKAWLDANSGPNHPISRVRFVDVRQSMRNGGGPACLRLRVVLSDEQLKKLGGRCILDDSLYGDLTAWVTRHYRETLTPPDLADPAIAGRDPHGIARTDRHHGPTQRLLPLHPAVGGS